MIFYKKASSDLGGQQVMCFMEWESLVKSFFERTESFYLKKRIVSGENAKIPVFLHTDKL